MIALKSFTDQSQRKQLEFKQGHAASDNYRKIQVKLCFWLDEKIACLLRVGKSENEKRKYGIQIKMCARSDRTKY